MSESPPRATSRQREPAQREPAQQEQAESPSELAANTSTRQAPNERQASNDQPSTTEPSETSASAPVPVPVPPTLPAQSDSVAALRRSLASRGPLPAGEVIVSLLGSHAAAGPDPYLDIPFDLSAPGISALAGLGPVHGIEEHLAAAGGCWNASLVPRLTGRHVILGLALDPSLGIALINAGIIGSLLRRWTPGSGTPQEPHRLTWDVLGDSGRELAEAVPVLAAGYGAPAEATIHVPGDEPVRAMAWSASGDRLAVLAGSRVLQAEADAADVHQIGELPETVTSIGWSGRDVVGLSVDDGSVQVLRMSEGGSLGVRTGQAGLISGDGSTVWLLGVGVERWVPGETTTQPLLPVTWSPADVLGALDRTGSVGLLRVSDRDALVDVRAPRTQTADPAQTSTPLQTVQPVAPPWPVDAVGLVGFGPSRHWPAALVLLGGRTVFAYATPDGVELHLPGQDGGLCRVACGPAQVTAMAVDATGTRLAVAIGPRVSVWTLATGRASSSPIPAYDTDQPEGSPDLLNSDRDAEAIAALTSADQLRPPLSIGLFGAWGSGKSFVLDRVSELLASPHRPAGYLSGGQVAVVRFNAWHYAETNLWASLVNEVLRKIAPSMEPVEPDPPEIVTAREVASQARQAAVDLNAEVVQARQALTKAEKDLNGHRRLVLWVLAVALVAAGGLSFAALTIGVNRILAAFTALVAFWGAAATILTRTRAVVEQGQDVVESGRAGVAMAGQVIGQPQAVAVRRRAVQLAQLSQQQQEADALADRLAKEQEAVQKLAAERPLAALLRRLSTANEYRDQLSLVTRTRDYFQLLNQRIRDEKAKPTASGTLQRVVVIIDDLDRCPAEKVVAVLEAVHLLFSFEMFVVLVAVDTRWLEQSLQIHYRALLGEPGTAHPRDYLEKIIQVPIHLPPLDETAIRTLIAGLVNLPIGNADNAAPPLDGTEQHAGPSEPGPNGSGPLTASTPRTARGPLPAEVMQITPREAEAMSKVAPLIGTTPRTTKRFVNTYRLLKARALDPARFDAVGPTTAHPPAGSAPLGDHEVVAFLLSVVTGHPDASGAVLPALLQAAPGMTAAAALTELTDVDAVRDWLQAHPRYGSAPAERFAPWVREVSRVSFTAI